MIKLIKNITNEHVSVSCILESKLAILDSDLIGDSWYVCRVNVPEKFRGTGIGSKILQEAISEIKKLSSKESSIIVYPGGYDSDTKRQNNFYIKNGFVKNKKEGGLILYLNNTKQKQ